MLLQTGAAGWDWFLVSSCPPPPTSFWEARKEFTPEEVQMSDKETKNLHIFNVKCPKKKINPLYNDICVYN